MRKTFLCTGILTGCLAVTTYSQGPERPPTPPTPPKTEATPRPPKPPSASDPRFAARPEVEPSAAVIPAGPYVIAPGTRILLSMINSVSTRAAQVGDRIYLETAFPVVVDGKILIPQGSWVTGTISSVKRPGRVKGKGELAVQFDSLVLPNGISRSFRGDLAAIDARDDQKLRREDSKIVGPGDKRGDTGTVISSTTAGTVIGSGVGAAAGSVARGAGIGAAGGAAAGLIGVLMSHGPDAMLSRGSTVEMTLDRPLQFSAGDVDFHNAPPRGNLSEGGNRPAQQQRGWPSRSPL